jgi:hypothetical protein
LDLEFVFGLVPYRAERVMALVTTMDEPLELGGVPILVAPIDEPQGASTGPNPD